MAATTTAARPTLAAPHSETGIWSWITTVDHKRIGIMYGVVSFFYFLVGGVEALLVRLQLAVPNNHLLSADFYNQMFTMHAVTMVFLALMPLTAAFFNFLIPLQIGARDVAFPRMNALSFWVFFFGGLFINFSFLLSIFGSGSQAPNAGWFAYANLTTPQFSPNLNMDFYVLGLQIVGLSSILSAINFIVTILNLRAPGMRLMRMPTFTWMALVTQVLLATALSVITVALTQLMFDRLFGAAFYDVSKGGDPMLWMHLFWMFGHPEVYILILPIFGMISEVVPVFSRKPLFGYSVIVFSGVLIAWLGFGVWSHHMFATGLGPIADSFFAISTMLIAIPTGIKIFNWLGTMWGGALRFTTSMMFAIAFIAMFTIGGLSGVMHAIAPADLQQTDTYFIVAHIHYVFFGGTVLGLWAGIYYWYPKVFGRMLDERLGQAHFWLNLIGMNITFFPMHFLGLHGMPRRIFTYAGDLGFNEMNLLATVGSFLIAIATLIFAINLVISRKRGALAGPNPWGAATLEWAMPSPPPVYNFREIPVVHSRMPLWETDPTLSAGVPQGRTEEDTATITLGGAAIAEMEYPDDESKMSAHDLGIHLPPSSFWPIVVAFGILSFFGLMILRHAPGQWQALWHTSWIGLLIIIVGVYGWAFEPGYYDHGDEH
jgi:cytochrome c oxidase subunit 1